MADSVNRLNSLERAAGAASPGVSPPVTIESLVIGSPPFVPAERQRGLVDTTVQVVRVAAAGADVVGSVIDIAHASDTPEAVAGVFELAVALFEFL